MLHVLVKLLFAVFSKHSSGWALIYISVPVNPKGIIIITSVGNIMGDNLAD